jgi:hypothetical protein
MISLITQYIRSLANRHTGVKSFFAGDVADLNMEYIQYPLVFLHDEFSFRRASSEQAVVTNWQDATVKFSVYTNIAYDKVVNPTHEDREYNYIKVVDDQVQTRLLNTAYSIAMDMVQEVYNRSYTPTTATSTEQLIIQNMLLLSYSIESEVRQWNDDVTGFTVTLDLRLPIVECTGNFGEDDLTGDFYKDETTHVAL